MIPRESGQHCRGCLYLVATPIGNLEDISLRALRVLKEADVIACEDTRQTLKLLSHFEIRKPLESYHEHNEMIRAPELVRRMEEGARVALVSDAGTPLISDPGHRLVFLCLQHKIPVISIPGASALIAALAASGLVSDEFTFAGFLPARAAERRRKLREFASEPRVLVFYEAPHRLRAFLKDAFDIFGDREMVMARELTKVHEEFARGKISDLLQAFSEKEPRGEITLLIAPPEMRDNQRDPACGDTGATAHSFAQRVEQIAGERNADRKAALKQAAKEFGLTKREAYKRWLTERNS